MYLHCSKNLLPVGWFKGRKTRCDLCRTGFFRDLLTTESDSLQVWWLLSNLYPYGSCHFHNDVCAGGGRGPLSVSFESHFWFLRSNRSDVFRNGSWSLALYKLPNFLDKNYFVRNLQRRSLKLKFWNIFLCFFLILVKLWVMSFDESDKNDSTWKESCHVRHQA